MTLKRLLLKGVKLKEQKFVHIKMKASNFYAMKNSFCNETEYLGMNLDSRLKWKNTKQNRSEVKIRRRNVS